MVERTFLHAIRQILKMENEVQNLVKIFQKNVTWGELSLSTDFKVQFSPFLWSQKAIIPLPVAFMMVMVRLMVLGKQQVRNDHWEH